MKQSVTCISGIFLIMMFTITSVTFGADLIPKTGITQAAPLQKLPNTTAVQKLPNTITINSKDVNMKPFGDASEQYKTDWKQISGGVNDFTYFISKMDQYVALLNSKVGECKNKSYSTTDMTAAGCADNMSIADCSKLLYKNCLQVEYHNVVNLFFQMADTIDATNRMLSKFSSNNTSSFIQWYLNNVKNISTY